MILVTGGNGFIGMHTTRKLLDAGESVVVGYNNAQREPAIWKDEIGKRVFPERVDTSNAHAVMDAGVKHGITGIVHLVSPRLGVLSPGQEMKVNMDGLINVLETARILGVKRVSVASSNSVYGKVPDGPFREADPLYVETNNPIDAFKKSFEVLGLHYGDRTNVEVVMMRISGVFGPLYYSMFSAHSRMTHAAAKGAPADFGGSLTGAPFEDDRSDYAYVKDIATGIQKLQLAPSLPNQIYNIGSGRADSYGEVVAAVKKLVPGAQIELQKGASGKGKANPVADISRIGEDVGFAPEYTLESAIAEYLEWLKTNDQ
jgi:UDP-glucose 4-epimerase